MTAGSARDTAVRIGLVRAGDRPRVNKRLYELLASTFDCPVDDIDVLSRVRSSPVASASAVVSGAFGHVGGLVSGRTTKKRAFVDSRGFNHFAHSIVASEVSPLTHRFTFQSQSLCHVAVPGVPHFVYTDHAHLANAVAELLGACDLFCLPTHAEPFGVAFVEAMHAGLPVVATSVGAIPELVEPGVTGELVEPGDVQRLAQALASCVGDPAHSIAMGELGRAVAGRRYSWDVVMSRIRELVTERLASASEPTVTR